MVGLDQPFQVEPVCVCWKAGQVGMRETNIFIQRQGRYCTNQGTSTDTTEVHVKLDEGDSSHSTITEVVSVMGELVSGCVHLAA